MGHFVPFRAMTTRFYNGRTSDYLSPFRILLVEPNPLMRRITRDILFLLGGRKVIDTGDVHAAAQFLAQGNVDMVLSEWYLTGACGVDLVRWIRNEASDIRFTPIIMLTSQTRVQNIVIARNSGITEFVAKPFTAKSLCSRIREVVERPRPFVSVGKYFGPDRRRRPGAVDKDRRGASGLLAGGYDLSQGEIDDMISGGRGPRT
ncbi:MAG: response regulator [Rhodospirillaceae bacterium]|nr:response regulator [Rhodospirillaceae bacterium]